MLVRIGENVNTYSIILGEKESEIVKEVLRELRSVKRGWIDDFAFKARETLRKIREEKKIEVSDSLVEYICYRIVTSLVPSWEGTRYHGYVMARCISIINGQLEP